jgi:hypothetical protein
VASCSGLSGKDLQDCLKAEGQMLRTYHEEADTAKKSGVDLNPYQIEYPFRYSADLRQRALGKIKDQTNGKGVPVEPGRHALGQATKELNRKELWGLIDEFIPSGCLWVASRNSGIFMRTRAIKENSQSIVITDQGEIRTFADHPGISDVSAPVTLTFSYIKTTKEIVLDVQQGRYR